MNFGGDVCAKAVDGPPALSLLRRRMSEYRRSNHG